MVLTICGTGGNSQLTSPDHGMLKASDHPDSGWKYFELNLNKVEDARGVKLESRVRGIPRYKLTPLLATHREGRHNAPHDEYAPKVIMIHDDPVPTFHKVGCECQEENVDAVELPQRGAGVCVELDGFAGVPEYLAPAHARRGCFGGGVGRTMIQR